VDCLHSLKNLSFGLNWLMCHSNTMIWCDAYCFLQLKTSKTKTPCIVPEIPVLWNPFFLSSSRRTDLQTITIVGGMLRSRRSWRKKHLRQIPSKAVPKLAPIKLRHSDMSQDEGVNRLKDEMINRPMIVCVMIVIDCKGHKCNFTQATPCVYK
jgi:hypothetical protein